MSVTTSHGLVWPGGIPSFLSQLPTSHHLYHSSNLSEMYLLCQLLRDSLRSVFLKVFYK